MTPQKTDKLKLFIRKIDIKDADVLYKVGLQEFGKEFWFTKKYIKDTITPPSICFGAFINRNMVGGILAKELDRPKLWIFFFIVNRDYRRKGIGEKLLKKIEQKCSFNFPLLFVDIGAHDKIACNFYLKNKFKKLAKLKDWFGVGCDAYICSKRIK
jgi:ribosomal protein S18 acetylase RimI-like enzyme